MQPGSGRLCTNAHITIGSVHNKSPPCTGIAPQPDLFVVGSTYETKGSGVGQVVQPQACCNASTAAQSHSACHIQTKLGIGDANAHVAGSGNTHPFCSCGR